MEECKGYLSQFFAQKPQMFYNNEIVVLPPNGSRSSIQMTQI